MTEEAQQRFVEEYYSRETDLAFAMAHNGFEFDGRKWSFAPEILEFKSRELNGLRVSMFGPGSDPHNPFFQTQESEARLFSAAFFQKPVTDVIRKYRRTDEDQAGRIAYVLGGIVRTMSRSYRLGDVNDFVEFVAKMTMLGDHKSGDAIASAAAMYVLSGGDIEEDKNFEGLLYHMADVISEDPIVPRETADLGLSQTVRLRTFIDELKTGEKRPYPQISKDMARWADFPTVGAEFHFSPDFGNSRSQFWQRLALLNASMFQLGNFVQFSRDDRGVVEVRMNPSVYPVTVALWSQIKEILPEVNKAYFTMTFNQDGKNFDWDEAVDKFLLTRIKGLGLLAYATVFKSLPEGAEPDEINFGSIYLGQTVKMLKGKFRFSGLWNGGKGKHGQLGIYAGYGSNFPYLGYYPSMALANPDILRGIGPFLSSVHTLEDAIKLPPDRILSIFELIQNRIDDDPMLSAASEAGTRIVKELTP